MRYGLLLAALTNSFAAAFHHVAILPLQQRQQQQRSIAIPHLSPLFSTAQYPRKVFERAIECASETCLCKDDELVRLADQLESYAGCIVDDDECDQEKVDRQDVVDILRADAALQLRLVYLNNVNIFKERVDELKNQNQDDSPPALKTRIRSVECASTPGLCKDSDELNRLADELEAYKGCLVEEDGDQEKVDRQDVVDILRMQSSLLLRQVYLQNVNLFKERVEEAATAAGEEP